MKCQFGSVKHGYCLLKTVSNHGKNAKFRQLLGSIMIPRDLKKRKNSLQVCASLDIIHEPIIALDNTLSHF